MSRSARVANRWIPLAALATASSFVIYAAVQQVGRQTADEPQVQLARGAAAAVGAGQQPASVTGNTAVAIERSLAPWVTIVAEDGRVVSSSGRLHGAMSTVPTGVLDHARVDGEQRVTWQPEAGVRMATIVVHNRGGGFAVAGRSLTESELRTGLYRRLILAGWLATLAGLLVVVFITETLVPVRSAMT